MLEHWKLVRHKLAKFGSLATLFTIHPDSVFVHSAQSGLKKVGVREINKLLENAVKSDYKYLFKFTLRSLATTEEIHSVSYQHTKLHFSSQFLLSWWFMLRLKTFSEKNSLKTSHGTLIWTHSVTPHWTRLTCYDSCLTSKTEERCERKQLSARTRTQL